MRNKTQHRLHLAAPRLNEMKLLQCLASDPDITQAELARRCGLSVAMVNNYMKDLCAAGLLVYHRKSSKNISYHLTTAGSMRAEEIGQELLQEMVESFAMAKERIRNLILSQVPPGPLRVVLYGLDDLAVIAFHALDCRDLRIVGVCDDDPGRIGREWCGREVSNPSQIRYLAPDAVVICDRARTEEIYRSLRYLHERGIRLVRLDARPVQRSEGDASLPNPPAESSRDGEVDSRAISGGRH
ncbi:MAG: putative transcriptional regulator [Acidobacteria bacterium]|nr:putative transcriptional regulator [Acidobacteriota bacterium]